MLIQSKCILVASLLLVTSCLVFGQHQEPKTPERDVQSIAILTRVLQAAGGQHALAAVHDITEKGEITFYWAKSAKGPLVIQMLGNNHFRMQADLADEKQTWVVRNALGSYVRNDKTVPLSQPEAANFENLTYPLAHVASALADSNTDISFVGIEKRKDSQVYRVRVKGQLGLATRNPSQPVVKDLLIDALDFDIVGVEDHPFPTHRLPNAKSVDTTPRQVDFADFRVVRGLRVPFLITTKVHEQEMLQIHLGEVHFNTSLSDEQFKR